METELMTVAGAEALREQLQRLKDNRHQLLDALAQARAHGDLRENAEYHSARDQQGLEEAKIRDLEAKLARAQVIDVTALEDTGKAVFGTRVMLRNTSDDAEVEVQIVGSDEADPALGRISVNAPLARALIGRQAGDIVTVQLESDTVANNTEYEILNVVYK